MPDKEPVQIEIEDLAFDGKSVGHLNGKVVFCDRGLPGETVLARITRSRARYSQAAVEEIISKCTDRREPVCPHVRQCGGCTWQDLIYARQLACKQQQVVACLEHIGGLENTDVAAIRPCESEFFYRNKMEFSFHVRPDNGFNLGLHRRGRFDDIFDLTECHLQSDLSNRIVAWTREFVRSREIPVYDVRDHTGFMRFLVIREGKRTGQVLVNLVTNVGSMPFKDILVSSMCVEFPQVTTIVQNQTAKKANVAVGESEEILYGPGYIEEEMCGLRFRIMSNSFFQTNSRQAEVLYETGFELLQPVSTDRLLDLYCGTGTIGILAASKVAEVIGVELVPDAIEIARKNSALNNIGNIAFFQGHVKDVLNSDALAGQAFDAVVVDPPRAGLHPRAMKRLMRLRSDKLLYISCNPATFSRDARHIVRQEYSLHRVIPVDMFPQTKHIELAALFQRTK
ncbi:MAG: 23S rRNA (uracil(1939)-C(5))-methyltransferase RlmD [Candidatus Zixiibacteriota bacterium]|nr:MAG: 23S rRNA (uracil(1939)-C(5))-methyltransferase RlmD [candidate division Zixibacteria bacterium]